MELRRFGGWLGGALQSIPEWIIAEADRRARQDYEREWERETPYRLTIPDPWKFLLDVPDVPGRQKRVFRAAQSQIKAYHHLTGLAFGFATVKTDHYREMQRAELSGDSVKLEHHARKLFDALLEFKPFRDDLKSADLALDLQRELQSRFEDWRKYQVRHQKKQTADNPKPLPRFEEAMQGFKAERVLVENWLICRIPGLPGFMFWSNIALAKLAYHHKPDVKHLDSEDPRRAYLRKLIQRLKLQSVNDTDCCVWAVEVKSRHDGGFDLTGNKRNGAEVFRVENLRPFQRAKT